MRETKTKILFPDAEDPNIPSLKKSNVRIIGDIDQVYLARQQLIVIFNDDYVIYFQIVYVLRAAFQ
jgi:hypothetical protein